MAAGVLPTVRMIFPCDLAVLDITDEQWTLTNPWTVVTPEPGAGFPFVALDFWVYAQFSGGVGSFSLAVEVRQARDDGSRRTVGWSEATRMDFPAGQQLLAFEMAFHMKRIPFREPGLYEFCTTCAGTLLGGEIAELRVLDRRATV